MTPDEQLLKSSENALWWLHAIRVNTVGLYFNGYTRSKLDGMINDLASAINGVTGRTETTEQITERVFAEARDGNAETDKRKQHGH